MTPVRYTLLDPTGNVTVLVETPVPVALQPGVATRIMEREPDAEQVGFLSPREGGVAMRMAGGEFCGNAAMSAAALYALDRGLSEVAVPVFVAGTPTPVRVDVSALPDGGVRGVVTMPSPISVREETFPEDARHPVVRFPGICHVILEDPMEQAEAERLAPVWCRHLASECVGLMLLDRSASALTPLVYVPSAGTLCWENSCASGTAAVGAYLAAQGNAVSLSLREPGGSLHIAADRDGGLRLTGTVRLRHRGSVQLSL